MYLFQSSPHTFAWHASEIAHTQTELKTENEIRGSDLFRSVPILRDSSRFKARFSPSPRPFHALQSEASMYSHSTSTHNQGLSDAQDFSERRQPLLVHPVPLSTAPSVADALTIERTHIEFEGAQPVFRNRCLPVPPPPRRVQRSTLVCPHDATPLSNQNEQSLSTGVKEWRGVGRGTDRDRRGRQTAETMEQAQAQARTFTLALFPSAKRQVLV